MLNDSQQFWASAIQRCIVAGEEIGPISAFYDGAPLLRFLRGVDGVYPDTLLFARLCGWGSSMKWKRRVARLDQKAATLDLSEEEWAVRLSEMEAKFLARRIKRWSLDFPPTAENIQRLHPELLARLLALILHDKPGDPLPLQEHQATEATADVIMIA